MPRPTRTNTTLLIVCEGYAEVELVRVLRDIYLPRGCGYSVRPENCRGGGGVLALTIQRQQEAVYDRYGLVIDTDKHWTAENRATAKAHGITAVECTPCLEAMLLAVDGQRVHAGTPENKVEFERVYGGPASRPGVIARHFPRSKFDAARARAVALDQLLVFLGV
jgi:hypothetical protein